ncbi:MAG: hypothetical protein H7A51_13835 [Akkermansiaceae bacterium]|nr:hypothetical protein [Akkermansiaceae bacterium]
MNITSIIGIAATVLALLACLGVAYTYYRDARSKEESRLILFAASVCVPVVVSLFAITYFLEIPGMYAVMLGVAIIFCRLASRKITKLRVAGRQVGVTASRHDKGKSQE